MHAQPSVWRCAQKLAPAPAQRRQGRRGRSLRRQLCRRRPRLLSPRLRASRRKALILAGHRQALLQAGCCGSGQCLPLSEQRVAVGCSEGGPAPTGPGAPQVQIALYKPQFLRRDLREAVTSIPQISLPCAQSCPSLRLCLSHFPSPLSRLPACLAAFLYLAQPDPALLCLPAVRQVRVLHIQSKCERGQFVKTCREGDKYTGLHVRGGRRTVQGVR